jgi:hypothetical protein
MVVRRCPHCRQGVGRRQPAPRLRLHGAATLLILDSLNFHLGAVRLLTRPVTLYLQLEGCAKKGANQDDDREDEEVIERRVDDNSPNDIPRDKGFESEKDGTSQVLTTDAICAQGVGLAF